MKILPISTSFYGADNVMREGLSRFAVLHQADQEWLLYQEELRQWFNEIHPEFKTKCPENPLDKYIEEVVSTTRNIKKYAKNILKTGKL